MVTVIRLNIKISAIKSFMAKLILSDIFQTNLITKPKNLPVPWSSNIYKQYKSNEINLALHCSKKSQRFSN